MRFDLFSADLGMMDWVECCGYIREDKAMAMLMKMSSILAWTGGVAAMERSVSSTPSFGTHWLESGDQ